MRFLSASFAVFFIAVVVAAQAPSAKAPQAPPKAAAPAPKAPAAPVPKAAPTNRPAPLANVMRGILFPNSNLIFDVQQNDPGVPKKPAAGTSGSTSDTFANVYTGWEVVEDAAVSLDEVVDSITKPGRVCSNGKPVPVQNADFKKFAQGLRDVARQARAAAQAKNRDKLNDVGNDLSDACSNCHEIYRDAGPAGSPLRCVPAKPAK